MFTFRFVLGFITGLIGFICMLQGEPVRIGLITGREYVGDREVAWRMKIAGEKLGWQVFLDQDRGRLLNYNELDWVVCMLPDSDLSDLPCSHFLMVFHPFTYLNRYGAFKSFFEKYDGYLLTIRNRTKLREGLRKKNNPFRHVRFYPSLYNIPYRKLSLHDLVVMIPVWGNRINDPKFGTLYKLLSDSGFAKFYGPHSNPNVDPQKYFGSIPFDGKSVINVLQRHGIVFVFHSEKHNAAKIPSARIFEAAAASAVIISDQNAFVKKHFGNSVFYVDTSKSGKEIFDQIQKHMQTIFQNPGKARRMAKKSHEIFTENFTMEAQLLRVHAMHRAILRKKNKL